MNGWAKACAVTTLAFAASGCALIQGPGLSQKHAQLHPSSTENDDDLRVLEKPSGIIAVGEDAIVRVVGPSTTCTGTLIDDDLILTAHHCVVERGPQGEFEKKLLDPTGIKVELGGEYFAWGEVSVRHIVAPPCGEGGGAGDVAILVLTRKIIGLTPLVVRLEAPPKTSEEAFPIGFGRCALSGDAIRRKGRDGSPIGAISGGTLTMEAAICPGDSGGPVFSRKSREIIGVVSLSAMDHDEKTRGASVMARVDAYRSVFEQAKHIADGQSPQELPPLECNAAPAPKRP